MSSWILKILKIDDLGPFFVIFLEMVLCLESGLRYGYVESFDILQHDDLYQWGDAGLYEFSKF